jgi:UDP-N-acetylglucosamine 2-epimerase (non-hydrolysing)
MIHFVIGTRAQLFKMAPIMLECQKRKLKWRWIYTAQHRDTMKESLKTFGLPDPDYTVIKWNTEAKTMGKLWVWFGRMMLALFSGRRILGKDRGKKHIVVTHGDTITTWWAALLGKLNRCKVMHVEAGLRSFKLFDPFPEEINRLITSRLADYYIAPGKSSIKNLEKYKGVKIDTTFNTQADTIEFGLKKCDAAELDLPKTKYVVVSIHRYENIFKEERFIKIVDLLELVAKKFPIYFVQHPATKEQIEKIPEIKKRITDNKQINLLPRLEYLPFIKLIKNSEFVVTDGGGNQEELYFMGKPTLLFRYTTERPDELGKTAALSKLDPKLVHDFIVNYKNYRQPRVIIPKSPSAIIADELKRFS